MIVFIYSKKKKQDFLINLNTQKNCRKIFKREKKVTYLQYK